MGGTIQNAEDGVTQQIRLDRKSPLQEGKRTVSCERVQRVPRGQGGHRQTRSEISQDLEPRTATKLPVQPPKILLLILLPRPLRKDEPSEMRTQYWTRVAMSSGHSRTASTSPVPSRLPTSMPVMRCDLTTTSRPSSLPPKQQIPNRRSGYYCPIKSKPWRGL